MLRVIHAIRVVVIMMSYRPRDAIRVGMAGGVKGDHYNYLKPWCSLFLFFVFVCFGSFFFKCTAAQTLFVLFLSMSVAISLPMQRFC